MIGVLFPAYVENISTRKDKTIKIVLSTQEVSPSTAGELFRLLNNLGVCYISPKSINQAEVDQVDALDADLGGKTQSQRIRNVLYKLFEQNAEGFKDFNTYYHSKTEAIIEHFKAKIEQ